MLFKNKGVSDSTVLKIVSKILRDNESTKGFRVSTSKGKATLTYAEIIKFVDALAERLADGRYGVIRRCDTCGNFSRSGRKGRKGWCSPKDCNLYRANDEYCSKWIPMTKEQQYTKEVINEHFKSSQTK